MSALRSLRTITWVEGLSYLVLVCVAMPLKYFWDLPLAVRVAGGLHGFLFLAFTMGLYQAHLEQGWRRRYTLGLFVASFIPGSLFWLDGQLRGSSAQEERNDLR